MRIIFTLVLAFFAKFLFAQSFEKNFILSSNIKGLEYAYSGLELSNGNSLIGINNSILCLSQNGDSLWKKTYTNYGDILKIFKNNQGKVILATTIGKMVMLEINEANGDTVASFRPPGQFANSGYIIYDVKILPDGDYILLYTNGGGNGATITRFTPKSNTAKWSRDYAGQNYAPRTILMDDTCLVMAGYKGNTSTNWMFDINVSKLSINNVPIWSKTFVRNNSSYRDRLMGIQKNNAGNYLVACNWIVNERGCPAIFILSQTGDSLGLSTYVAHAQDSLNHGYAYSLERSGSNGFIAAGLINFNKTDPQSNMKGMGHLCAIKVSEQGNITQVAPFNNLGFYEFASGNYDVSNAWGNGGFFTQDGHYLIYGVGNIKLPGTSPNSFSTYFKSYVVKGKFNATGNQKINGNESKHLIYPNPATNSLFVTSENMVAQVRILNMQGNLTLEIKDLENNEIDISQLPEGLYFLEIINKDGQLQYSQFLKFF